MASFASWVGRAVFFALIAIQAYFLAFYPVEYGGNVLWYFLLVTFAPALLLWLFLISCSGAKLCWLFYVWDLYVIVALVPNIAVIFGVVGDGLYKDRFLGSNTLKMVLCITPLLLLLLLHTADDSDRSKEYRELVSKLSFHMAIDLFDVVDMIDIVLEENEHDIGIPKVFGKAMIVVACYTLLLTPWQLAENKPAYGRVDIRSKTAIVRNIVQIVFVNLVFLVIRSFVLVNYGKDESIFIAKNGIAIFLSILEIRQLCSSSY